MQEIKPYTMMYSTIFKQNVEVIRVYKDTVTIRVTAGGLREGELMTFRGQRKDTLLPIKRLKSE
ncbi:hypothetical protein [Paenibacillus naphthalenovorans]|uniref:Uncharacterized protein n=1 Tax=Paenibacillus naphthalenovorans TaxID=162209 RepID=A0A0U2W4C4_9BACL|nr:hypothetical protein [Paenibacillus naphthalenovorans]ALS22269.1 hypothetical protein IJ22_18950 [Paenibacillus naphthalenovorans]